MKDAVEMATEIGLSDKRQGLGNLPYNPSPAPLILITGSFYTIGEAKEVLGQRGILARLRE